MLENTEGAIIWAMRCTFLRGNTFWTVLCVNARTEMYNAPQFEFNSIFKKIYFKKDNNEIEWITK
jgi:hypothetical protein